MKQHEEFLIKAKDIVQADALPKQPEPIPEKVQGRTVNSNNSEHAPGFEYAFQHS